MIDLLNLWGERFAQFAAPMLWQSMLLILLLFAADAILRRKVRAVIRHALWLMVLVKLVLPPTLTSPTSIAYYLPSGVPSRLALANLSASQTPPAPVTDQPAVPHAAIATAASIPSSASLSVRALLMLAWVGGAALLGTWLAFRCRDLIGILNRTTPAPCLAQSLMEECRLQLRIRQPLPLRCSTEIASPALCGLWHPVIILPAGLCVRMPAARLRAILLHELGHQKRGDLWINKVQTLLQILYWYNPLLWLASARIRHVREQAVDETVLVAMRAEAEEYPSTLLQVARMSLASPALGSGFIGILESGGNLTRRIRHILDMPMPRRANLGASGIMAALLFALLLLPMACGKKIVSKAVTGLDTTRVVISGMQMPEAQAEALESRLKKDPEDIYARCQLLGYYSTMRFRPGPAREKRQEQILWFITHHPEMDLQSFTQIDPVHDTNIQDKAKSLWTDQIKSHPGDAVILGNAAGFFTLIDRKKSEELLSEAQGIEPNNAKWSSQLANLYYLDSNFESSPAKEEHAKKAWEQMEHSYAATTDELSRFLALPALVKMAYAAGEFEKVREYATSMLEQSKKEKPGWDYGEAIRAAHLYLGRLALREGKIDEARQHLLDSAKTPELTAFGPNMSLAKELLEHGEKEAVLEYFTLSSERSWTFGKKSLDQWAADVRAGKMPDFSANLIY